MRHPPSKLLKTYHGVLSLLPGTDKLSFINSDGKETLVHETPRTRGLRNFLWEPVTLVGWLHREKNRSVLEVIDFSSEQDPSEFPELDDIQMMMDLSVEGEVISIPQGNFAA